MGMGPVLSARNPVKFEAAKADRAEIDALLRTRSQAEPLLVPKDVLRLLEWPDCKLRTVQRHFRRIREARLSDVQRHLSTELSEVH
jgi:hypothetical protein